MAPPLPPESSETAKLGTQLADSAYLRHRLSPSPSEGSYLYLSDLLAVTLRFAAQVNGALFDYGCGGSPYRELFCGCVKYVGADVTPGPAVDRRLLDNGMTEEPDETYDAVLSSQVLEHIQNPDAYLAECHRILKPGGVLLVTTHGMFEEHGCPFDFHRWTSRGLDQAVEDVGFEVIESLKLTTEIRGAIQLMHQFVTHLRCPGRPVLHFVFAVARKLYAWVGIPILNRLGKSFHAQGIVPGANSTPLYLGVAVTARKRK